MNRLGSALLLSLLLAFGWWGSETYLMAPSPTETYVQMIRAAQSGDEQGFLDGFTKESASVVGSLIVLARNYAFSAEPPIRRLVLTDVVEERIEGTTAVVLVRRGEGIAQVPLVLDQGRWKVNALGSRTAGK